MDRHWRMETERLRAADARQAERNRLEQNDRESRRQREDNDRRWQREQEAARQPRTFGEAAYQSYQRITGIMFFICFMIVVFIPYAYSMAMLDLVTGFMDLPKHEQQPYANWCWAGIPIFWAFVIGMFFFLRKVLRKAFNRQ